MALGWHATEFAQTSTILEFNIWFQFRPHHRNWHVILHQSPKFYPNWTPSAEKMTSCRFSRWRISAIMDFRGPVMCSLKSPCTTSYRSSIETIALNCLVFVKIAFFCIWATDRQTNRGTKPMHYATLAIASGSLISGREGEFIWPVLHWWILSVLVAVTLPTSLSSIQVIILSRAQNEKQEAQLSLTNRVMLVCKVVDVWQDFLSEYVDKKFTYICYRRLIRHEWIYYSSKNCVIYNSYKIV